MGSGETDSGAHDNFDSDFATDAIAIIRVDFAVKSDDIFEKC